MLIAAPTMPKTNGFFSVIKIEDIVSATIGSCGVTKQLSPASAIKT